MGFGVIIASGNDNKQLPDELMGCLAEVRVEQSLDRPTRFAMRFQEDYNEDGQPRIVEAGELAPERMITIAVPEQDEEGDGLKCLVRGPITEIKSSFAQGGPGSSFEAHGMDRRVEMDRVCVRRAWEGKVSGAAESILSSYGFEREIQETTKEYSTKTTTLNQRHTDLCFLQRAARQNNLCFWIAYKCTLNPLDPSGGSLEIEETAKFTSSPPRPDGSVSTPPPPSRIPLVATTKVRLVVNPPPEECQTVSSFDLNFDVERPASFEGQAVDDRTARLDPTDAEDRQPPVVKGGQDLADIAPSERRFCVDSPGDQLELRNRSESALTDSGWMLNATASTTAHMLGGVLMPHDVVEVANVGTRHSGPYQVSQVTHTINGADHHMEIQLRRNAIAGNDDGSSL